MATPLFDVIISVSGEDDGSGVYDVKIMDTYHEGAGQIGQKYGMTSLDEAMQFAKGAIAAFLGGTEA